MGLGQRVAAAQVDGDVVQRRVGRREGHGLRPGPRRAPDVQEFVYCLLASCDYDSFYSVMVREAMKLSANKPIIRAPVMAESKGGDDDDDDPKGGGGGNKGEK